MDILRYFEYTDESGEKEIILYNPNRITTFQARSAACNDIYSGADYMSDEEILRIMPADSFYRTFRSVLAYLEKCEPLDAAIVGDRRPGDYARLKQICADLDAKEVKRDAPAAPTESEVFLRFIREPGRGYTTAFDLRDVKDLHQAQLASDRCGWLGLSEEEEKELYDMVCPLYSLTCFDNVFANSDLPWLQEEKNGETGERT